jgi:uncharacterized protein (TIGR03066 family)
MRSIPRTALAILILTIAGAPAYAQPKDKDGKIDEKKLIGKWEPPDAPKDIKIVVEFAAKGKVTVSAEVGGKAEKLEGTYKLDGDKLTLNMKSGEKDRKETVTVTKLTDTELVTKDDKGKEETLKRVMEKKEKKGKKEKK